MSKQPSSPAPSVIPVAPEGFVAAIVYMPCVTPESHGDGKLQRLAREVGMQFGDQAYVKRLDGTKVESKKT